MGFLAALIYFTRLPLWKIITPKEEAYKEVVFYWPWVGIIIALISVAVLYVAQIFFPLSLAIIIMIAFRLLLTGAFHEDGLSDFCDGFGGGRTSEQILKIMKDSFIGSYGVIGLIIYFLLLWQTLSSLPFPLVIGVILAGDPFSRSIAGISFNRLPYVRKIEDCKTKILYDKMKIKGTIIALLGGLIPLLFLPNYYFLIATIPTIIVSYLFTLYLKKKIGGYTGDCCGALFLLNELIFYISSCCIYNIFYL